MNSHNVIKICLIKLLLLVSLMSTSTAQAAIFDRLTASPASRDVSTESFIKLPVTWSVVSSHAIKASLILNSNASSLLFEDGLGNSLGSVTGSQLTSTVSLPQSTRVTTTFSETLVISPDLIRKARLNKSNRVVIKRTFSGVLTEIVTQGKPAPIYAEATTSLVLNITTSGGGSTGFTINRLFLSFDNGLLAKTVTRGDVLKARLEISSQGTGIVRGIWELAEPTTTRGTAFFRPLKQLSKHVSGEQSFEVAGPDLPSNMDGLYILRFRMLAPSLDTVPMIRYMVKPAGSPEAGKLLLPLDLRDPPNKAVLQKNTKFTWQRIESAKYYQLEFFISPDPMGYDNAIPDMSNARRVAGVLVLGKNLDQELSELTRRHFNSGYHYYWHVIAIDGDGRRVAKSELRKVVVP